MHNIKSDFKKNHRNDVIEKYVKILPEVPGVYRMIGSKLIKGENETLYVGKAKNLKKRVTSYALGQLHSKRLFKLLRETIDMAFVTTSTEQDALLLEANYIKKYKPPYNVLLKDDKNFPYLLLTKNDDFPRLIKHRGKKNIKGDYFGPFASISAVNNSIETIQNVFMLRTCSDNIFNNRSRPCMLHFIKKCSAPCVGHISSSEYNESIIEAKNFLNGRSTNIIKDLSKKMENYSSTENYEQAAIIRDRISSLANMQHSSEVNINNIKNADIIALYKQSNHSCIQIFFFRNGQNWGSKSFFPIYKTDIDDQEIISSFITQFYLAHIIPDDIYLYNDIKIDQETLDFLNNKAEKNINFLIPKKGKKKLITKQAYENAKSSLNMKLSKEEYFKNSFKYLCEHFNIKKINHIEIYDNAHISGSFATGGYVVADKHGFDKKSYRRYKFPEHINQSDDYAMMKFIFEKRIKKIIERAKSENKSIEEIIEDDVSIIIIDGGINHIKMISKLFKENNIPIDNNGKSYIKLLAIAKPRIINNKNAIRSKYIGNEQFFDHEGVQIFLAENSNLVYFFQRLRDEAHRFINAQYRDKIKKSIYNNPLDELEGIGPKRKKILLQYFGSIKALSDANIDDICKCDNISKQLATKIYNFFHIDKE